jgi:hypothetical protein
MAHHGGIDAISGAEVDHGDARHAAGASQCSRTFLEQGERVAVYSVIERA